jgi:nitrate/TMAO reductase-like tetraheme cytochrome c subunit
MIATLNLIRVPLIRLLVLIVLAGLVRNASADSKEKRQKQDASSTSDSYMGLSGQELWSNNCLRCHNIRPPTMYSNAQWDVIVHHMRVRANITGQEQRAIVEFLKSSK